MNARVYFSLFHLTNTPPSKTTPFWPSLHLDVDVRECLFIAVQNYADLKMISSRPIHPSVGTMKMYLYSYLIHSQNFLFIFYKSCQWGRTLTKGTHLHHFHSHLYPKGTYCFLKKQKNKSVPKW